MRTHLLREFQLRRREKVLYTYDFLDLWEWEIRVLDINQIEIYFSILQRKVLTPNDFSSLQELQQRLLAFQAHYQQSASPFNWAFTRRDLNALLAKIDLKRLAPAA